MPAEGLAPPRLTTSEAGPSAVPGKPRRQNRRYSVRTAQHLFETQPQPGQRPPARLRHDQLQGRNIVVTAPDGERVTVRVGQYWPEHGFELHFAEGGYRNTFSNHLKRQGWKIPNIEPPKNIRQDELARLAAKMPRSSVGENQQFKTMPNRPNSTRRNLEYLDRRASTLRHEARAEQVVTAMLDEDFAYGGEDEEDYKKRAGGPADPWRQGNLGKFSFKGAKFTGKRPSLNGPAKSAAASKPGKHANRMSWKPGEEPEEKRKVDLGKPKDRWKWKPTQENIVPGTASPGAAPASTAMSLPDPDKEKETDGVGVADASPKASPGPASMPSAGAASLFGP